MEHTSSPTASHMAMAVSHDDPQIRREKLTASLFGHRIDESCPASVQQAVTLIKNRLPPESPFSAEQEERVMQIGAMGVVVGYNMGIQALADIVPGAIGDLHETFVESLRDQAADINQLDHKHDQLRGGVARAVANFSKTAVP